MDEAKGRRPEDERVEALTRELDALRERLAHAERWVPLKTQGDLSPNDARLDIIERTAGLGSWTWDISTNEVRWSQRLFVILGLNPAHDVPSIEAWNARIHPDDRARLSKQAQSIANDGEKGDLSEYRVVRPCGEIRYVRISGSNLFNSEGALQQIVGTVLDITERRLLETQLYHAQKMEALGRLAGGIAHDFNNYLTAVYGNIDLIRLELPEEEHWIERYLQDITGSIQRCRNLTQRLLLFGRRQRSKPQSIDLTEVVIEMTRMLQRIVNPNTSVEITSDGEPLFICADTTQLEQVIVNLVVNAQDAMPRGGLIKLSLCPERSPSASHAILSVTDEGHGIPEEKIKRIFEPFYSTKPRGSGLGLSTVYGIVQQHNAEIHVESSLGEGSTFTVRFPLAPPPLQARGEGVDRQIPTDLLKDLQVLVVDDVIEVREMTSRLLQSLGAITVQAQNGANALEVFERSPGLFDAIITDIVMPQLNGVELAQKIRARAPDLPIILMTGHADVELSEAEQSLINTLPLLWKPFDADALLSCFQAALSASPEPS